MAKNNSSWGEMGDGTFRTRCQSSFPPSEPTSDPEGRSGVSFLGYRNKGQHSGGSWAQMGDLGHLLMRKCPEPCLEHPHSLCQALGLFPLLHPQVYPQETAVARMWCLVQQEGDQEYIGTWQNPCKTSKGELIENESII